MAEKKIYKVSQIAKDFEMKAKDVTEIFKEIGCDKKSSTASVDAEEYTKFIEYVTSGHQIKNLEDYTSGKAVIRVVGERKTAEPVSEESAPEVKAEESVEAKPEAKAETKPEVKVEKKTEARTESGRDGNTARGDFRGGQSVSGRDGSRRDDRAPRRQSNEGGQNNGRQNSQTYYATGNNTHQRYTDRPQSDPFAKRRENMNRAAEGRYPTPRDDGRAQGGSRPQQQQQQRPAAPQNARVQQASAPVEKAQTQQASAQAAATVRPAQQAQLEKQQRTTNARAQEAQTKKKAAQEKRKDERRASGQKLRTITPSFDPSSVQGGVNIQSEYTAEAPRTRIVDTRTSDVNLSKYDDRYNEQFYAIANGTDTKAQKQKLKKQDNRGQNAKSAKDKERAAQERIKKMEAERARNKQLEITVPDEITVGELAVRLKKTSAEVIKKLMFMGEMKMVNDTVDYATAEIIADEFGAKVTREVVVTIEEKLFTEAEENEADLEERAPVVCVMGHVDHGKTSILDAIRHTNVTKGEAGGITQAIGAYRVKANGKDITFLDTPGHEAFTAMRMRGAKSTDIAILVVAADDGVMPQTIEAINHAKAAGIDIIVAINKMDKPQANPDNVLNQLTQYELVPEAWGGDVICVPVSALTGMGIDDLLESVLLVAEVKELKANPNRRAKGLVIESKLDRGRGPVATVLVQNGTLHQGDYVIVGNAVGRVRAMIDDKGKSVKVAGPSIPVEIVGLDDVPQAGDELNGVEDERMAKNLAEQRREKQRQEILAANARVNLDDLFSQIADGVKTLNIIVKADVAGSAEAVKASLIKLSNEEVKVSVIHSAVGGITESDVMLAAASNAIITGFNVRPDRNALDSAERNGVDIRTHRIIYEIIEEVEAAMKGMLAPTFKENLLGHAEVRQTIRVPNVGTIAGCYVLDGKITRQCQIRIVRDGVVIFEDKISSLRRFKDDVREVNSGYECGVGLDKFNDIKEGDMLEAFIMEEVKR